MAIRYSGDVEVRVRWTGRVYTGHVRAPGFRGEGTLTREAAGVGRGLKPTSSEAYDAAARAFLREAEKANRGRLPRDHDIRRTFRSPCPYVV